MQLKWLPIMAFVILFSSCEDEPKRKLKTRERAQVAFKSIDRPQIDANLAYDYVKKQVDFGPRVPGTKEHKACAEYLENELNSIGWVTEVQSGRVTTFDGNNLPIYNITGRFNPENPNRIMLFAHWDSRPFADRDNYDQKKAILGANDGASGVGVLLAIAKAISADSLKPTVGIDIVFFDAEDYGKPSGTLGGHESNTWCLGSQYWANNLPDNFVAPKYGVLLDMVGASDAVFPREGGSRKYNPSLVDKVWYLGQKLGYGQFFIDDIAYGGVTDDHVYVTELAKIPSIDIIHYNPIIRDFGHFHHKHADNMDVIDSATLYAVGETMLELIYREK